MHSKRYFFYNKNKNSSWNVIAYKFVKQNTQVKKRTCKKALSPVSQDIVEEMSVVE